MIQIRTRAVLLALTVCIGISAVPLHAQTPGAPAPPQQSIDSCCGVVTPEGRLLDRVIDSMHVEDFWQAKVHIDWVSGRQDQPAATMGPDRATHCSSFTAALGLKLDVYMLRPPEHPQQLLASAQARWFHSKEGEKDGWVPVATAEEAQSLANKGELVTVVFESPDSHRPGHIAIVRPIDKTKAALEHDGVETAQAGARNFSDGVARVSFAKHEDAWPNGVKYYAHTIDWQDLIAKWKNQQK